MTTLSKVHWGFEQLSEVASSSGCESRHAKVNRQPVAA